ncbi:hypothetical protein ACTL6U_14375 [Rhodovibrionaceae bacterium A322]
MPSFRNLFVACSLSLLLAACQSSKPYRSPDLAPIVKVPVEINVEAYESDYSGKIIDKKLWLEVNVKDNWSVKVPRSQYKCFDQYDVTSNIDERFRNDVKGIATKYYSDVHLFEPADTLKDVEILPGDEALLFESTTNLIYLKVTGRQYTSKLLVRSNVYGSFKHFFSDNSESGEDFSGHNDLSKKGYSQFGACDRAPRQMPLSYQEAYNEALSNFEAEFVKKVINR